MFFNAQSNIAKINFFEIAKNSVLIKFYKTTFI